MPSDNRSQRPHVALRRQRLEAFGDLRDGVGLEIGPLDSPVAPRQTFDVRYVDVLSTEALHEHYRGDPNVSLEQIVDVDFSLQSEGGMRTLAETVAPCAPYRWVIASHVLEHVPDLVGFLSDVAAVLEDDGLLMLIVPDRRFTFDANRPATSLGQVLQAHTLHDVIPSERAAYDHFRSVVRTSPAALWDGARPSDAPRMYTFEDAAAMRDAAARGEYIDSHVWVLSPAEFVSQLDDLGELDVCDFSIEHLLPTAPNELEFTAVLRRLPRSASADQRARLRRKATAALPPDVALDSVERQPGDAQQAAPFELSELETQLIRAKRGAMRRLRALRDGVVALTRR